MKFVEVKSISRYAARGLLVLVLIGAGYAFLYHQGSAADEPKFISATAMVRDLEETVIASGTLQALKQVSVGAQVSGQLKSLKVALGDEVKAGQLVAEIDSTTQHHALRDAQASLAYVRAQRQAKAAQLRQAELAFKRQQNMYAQEASSRSDLEVAEATLETTRAEIAALDAQNAQSAVAVDKAQADLNYTRITAPMDGKVVAVLAQEGQTVNSAQAAPTIVKLAALDTITIKAQVSEADVTRVKVGQAVYFTILGAPDQRHHAVLRAVEPAPESLAQEAVPGAGPNVANGTAVYYNALFDAPNKDGKFRIGMTAEVHIILAKAQGAVTIPSAALVDADKAGAYQVRVINDAQKVALRPVRLGIDNGINAQVLEGLSAGERVVVGEMGPAQGPGKAK
ncbi:efflux RND transporter periplasmic adaptor subunit [Noviherbaspirillum sp. Root189]|uniref:efflux RND transporter periplasmic adaptor subunit n=1 Tax=Noviherbaspirillum sp. Root189 TaxID=1736487 RepID=UPI0007091C50|nr:efflux RND transporter periplasmic adaptor subunit [Noviherbaspirillum sp. Root189]KRB72530.1 hemolysin secretion protein D [Noviherbaspirillum sp. Root189]